MCVIVKPDWLVYKNNVFSALSFLLSFVLDPDAFGFSELVCFGSSDCVNVGSSPNVTSAFFVSALLSCWNGTSSSPLRRNYGVSYLGCSIIPCHLVQTKDTPTCVY